jgi:glyoxylase-like metal-dependent hydrolase (beta-lactamase superfamily II)
MLTIGHHTIESVLDTVSRGDPTRMYPGSTLEGWSAHPGTLEADGSLQFAIGGYLVRGGGRVLLVDLGVGPHGWQAPSGASLPPGRLVDALRDLGVAPDEVTDVVLTHVHPDHVGWASVGETPTFGRATYRCHRRDWEHFVEQRNGDPSVWPVLEPVAERLEPWDGDGPLFAGLDLLDAPGHTPGSTVLTFSGPSGARAVLLGDVVHCPVELVDDEWGTIGDVDPELARRTRRRFARELEGSDAHVSAAHFPELRFGRLVVDAERQRRWGYGSSSSRGSATTPAG